MKVATSICIASVMLISSATAGDDTAVALTVTISGGQPELGRAVIAVFASRQAFLKEPVISKSVPIDKNGGAVLQFGQLSPGTYAISAYYDRDSNGMLNTGLFGIPTELVGFSNGAKGIFGPPAFKKAAFTLSSAQSISIRFGKAKN